MTSSEILKEVLSALDAGNYSKVGSYLDKNFRFSGPMPMTIGKAEFIAFERAMRAAAPDLKHDGKVISETKDGQVYGQLQVSGTHRKELDLPYIPKVAPTNKSFRLPVEKWSATVMNGKVVLFTAEVPADGGLIGILTQIGRADLADCLKTKGLNCRADYGSGATTSAHI